VPVLSRRPTPREPERAREAFAIACSNSNARRSREPRIGITRTTRAHARTAGCRAVDGALLVAAHNLLDALARSSDEQEPAGVRIDHVAYFLLLPEVLVLADRAGDAWCRACSDNGGGRGGHGGRGGSSSNRRQPPVWTRGSGRHRHHLRRQMMLDRRGRWRSGVRPMLSMATTTVMMMMMMTATMMMVVVIVSRAVAVAVVVAIAPRRARPRPRSRAPTRIAAGRRRRHDDGRR
jgi:hypothetical protein